MATGLNGIVTYSELGSDVSGYAEYYTDGNQCVTYPLNSSDIGIYHGVSGTYETNQCIMSNHITNKSVTVTLNITVSSTSGVVLAGFDYGCVTTGNRSFTFCSRNAATEGTTSLPIGTTSVVIGRSYLLSTEIVRTLEYVLTLNYGGRTVKINNSAATASGTRYSVSQNVAAANRTITQFVTSSNINISVAIS